MEMPLITYPPSTGGSGPSKIQYGLYAARPAAGVSGQIYYATDSGIAFLDNGAAWQPMLPGALGVEPPAAASWTSIVQAATTQIDRSGTIWQYSASAATAGASFRTMLRNVGTNTQWEAFISGFTGPTSNANSGSIGVCFRLSSGTKISSYDLTFNNAIVQLSANKYNDLATWNSNYINGVAFNALSGFWMRLELTGGNRIWSMRPAYGGPWVQLHSVASADFFGAVPDQVGWYINPVQEAVGATLLSWSESP